ncbi:hypothetical protein AB5J55_41610 [Streptomyces sp. R11]|uniref:Uncharacterized protein n=1 Tax=Streptomyces sp. R11 TaxID=3238625 RepID=A0AB39NB22_9ACTN
MEAERCLIACRLMKPVDLACRRYAISNQVLQQALGACPADLGAAVLFMAMVKWRGVLPDNERQQWSLDPFMAVGRCVSA